MMMLLIKFQYHSIINMSIIYICNYLVIPNNYLNSFIYHLFYLLKNNNNNKKKIFNTTLCKIIYLMKIKNL